MYDEEESANVKFLPEQPTALSGSFLGIIPPQDRSKFVPSSLEFATFKEELLKGKHQPLDLFRSKSTNRLPVLHPLVSNLLHPLERKKLRSTYQQSQQQQPSSSSTSSQHHDQNKLQLLHPIHLQNSTDMRSLAQPHNSHVKSLAYLPMNSSRSSHHSTTHESPPIPQLQPILQQKQPSITMKSIPQFPHKERFTEITRRREALQLLNKHIDKRLLLQFTNDFYAHIYSNESIPQRQKEVMLENNDFSYLQTPQYQLLMHTVQPQTTGLETYPSPQPPLPQQQQQGQSHAQQSSSYSIHMPGIINSNNQIAVTIAAQNTSLHNNNNNQNQAATATQIQDLVSIKGFPHLLQNSKQQVVHGANSSAIFDNTSIPSIPNNPKSNNNITSTKKINLIRSSVKLKRNASQFRINGSSEIASISNEAVTLLHTSNRNTPHSIRDIRNKSSKRSVSEHVNNAQISLEVSTSRVLNRNDDFLRMQQQERKAYYQSDLIRPKFAQNTQKQHTPSVIVHAFLKKKAGDHVNSSKCNEKIKGNNNNSQDAYTSQQEYEYSQADEQQNEHRTQEQQLQQNVYTQKALTQVRENEQKIDLKLQIKLLDKSNSFSAQSTPRKRVIVSNSPLHAAAARATAALLKESQEQQQQLQMQQQQQLSRFGFGGYSQAYEQPQSDKPSIVMDNLSPVLLKMNPIASAAKDEDDEDEMNYSMKSQPFNLKQSFSRAVASEYPGSTNKEIFNQNTHNNNNNYLGRDAKTQQNHKSGHIVLKLPIKMLARTVAAESSATGVLESKVSPALPSSQSSAVILGKLSARQNQLQQQQQQQNQEISQRIEKNEQPMIMTTTMMGLLSPNSPPAEINSFNILGGKKRLLDML